MRPPVPSQGTPLAAPGRMAFSDGGPSRTPRAAATVTECFLKTAAEHPGKGVTYVASRGNEVFETYSSILVRARRILSGLRKHGLAPGDCAILQVNTLQGHFAAFWACILGGIHPAIVAAAPSYERSNPVLMKLYNAWELLGRPPILASPSNADAVRGAAQVVGAPGFVTLAVEALEQEAECVDLYHPSPADVVFYQLTSGSTGTPKCVQVTHGGVICHIHSSAVFVGYREVDVVLNWLPMDHVVPTLTVHLKDACLGCNEVQVKTDAIVADPLLWLELMERHGVSHTWAPNFGFRIVTEALLARGPKSFDLSRVKQFMNAGEQVTLPVVEAFLNSVRPFGVQQEAVQPAFGMAEACTCMTYQTGFHVDTGAHWVLKSSLGGALMKGRAGGKNSISFVDLGPPVPEIQIRIVDRENRLLPEGIIGRFQIKGPVVTPGYFRNEEANRDALVGDGWFNSGDLGFIVDGRLALTGREKETIIIRGANFYCYEIEDIVNRVEGVEPTYSAACAVGVGSGSEGLAVFFVVSGRPGVNQTGVVRAIRSRVTSDIGVTPVCIVPVSKEEFPKTTSGKIQREQLRRLLMQGRYAERLAELDIDLENANTLPNWFFQTVWRRKEIANAEPASARAAVLLFDDDSAIAGQLRCQLARRGQTVIRVLRGSEFRKVSALEYSIDPRAASDYRRLIQSLLSDSIDPAAIAHLWTCAGAPVADFQIREDVLDQGVYSIVSLVQAIVAECPGASRKRLIIASTHAQAVSPADLIVSEKTMAAGLARTINQEVPSISCTHIDVQEASVEMAGRILNEIDSDEREAEVACRDQARWISRLERVPFDSAPLNGIPFKAGGIYLISGGAGGIGIEIASWLVESHGVRVLAIGRRDKSHHRFPHHLAANPDFFRYETVDVSSANALRQAVDRARRDWGAKLEGIFHLAAEYHECAVVDETRESLARAFRSKVYGAAALQSLLDEAGGIFVHFSSVTHVFGGATIGAYSIANRFLDAMSHRQRSEAKIQSYCFDWSTWDSVGMSKDYPAIESLRARGYDAISIRRGLQSLLAGLCRPPGNLIVGLDDTRPFLRRLSDSQPAGFRRPAALVDGRGRDRALPVSIEAIDALGRPIRCEVRAAGATDSAANRTAALSATERRIVALWKEILQLDSIHAADNFFELGGNSLLLVRMGARVEQEFRKKIGAVEMFRYPTIGKLAGYLDETGSKTEQAGMESALERASARKSRMRKRLNPA